MLRMRVLAAASARCARSAPRVMLPASTTWRNRLKSARSKRIDGSSFAFSEGNLRQRLIALNLLHAHVSYRTKLSSTGGSACPVTLRHARTFVRNTSKPRTTAQYGRTDGQGARRAAAVAAHPDLQL